MAVSIATISCCTTVSSCVSGFGVRFRIFGFRVSGVGCLVSSFRFQVSGFGLRVSGFGFRVSGSGFRIPSFKLRVSGFRLRVSGIGFRVPGSELQIPGSGFLASGFEFRVSSCRGRGAGCLAPRIVHGEEPQQPAPRRHLPLVKRLHAPASAFKFRIWGVGFRVWGAKLGCGDWGLGLRVEG